MAKSILSKKLRILHVAKWYPNRYDLQNGVFIQKHIDCTAAFAEVKVLAWLAGVEKTEIVESIEKNLPVTRYYFKKRTPISYKRHAFRDYIRGHFNNKNLPDVIHLHIFSPDLLLVMNWARKRKIPVVISEHWSGYLTGVFSQMPYWRKWSYKRLAKAATILPVSEFLKNGMESSGITGKYQIVPNVVASNNFMVKKRPIFTFLVVADLVDKIKNVSGIIKAFEEISQVEQPCELHIIGGGPDEKLTKDQVANSKSIDSIKLLGRLANSEVLRLMPSYHVLISNSRVESFGVVVLEAHAAGLPVISTLCGGPNEWLEEGDYPIQIDDDKVLAIAMTNAIKKYPNAISFEKWKKCLPESVQQQLHQVYRRVIA